MPSLHVCPLSRLSETVSATGASHVLTLATVGTNPERPAAITARNHQNMAAPGPAGGHH